MNERGNDVLTEVMRGRLGRVILERAHEHFTGDLDEARDDLRACSVCGAPTPGEVCAFCRMRARAVGEPIGIRSST